MIEIIANGENIKVDKTIDEIIGQKLNHQDEQNFKLEGLFEFSDGSRSFRKMQVSSCITKEEIFFIMNAPVSEYSGSKVWNSPIWIYFDEKQKKVYRGSACGVSISGIHESLRGF